MCIAPWQFLHARVFLFFCSWVVVVEAAAPRGLLSNPYPLGVASNLRGSSSCKRKPAQTTVA